MSNNNNEGASKGTGSPSGKSTDVIKGDGARLTKQRPPQPPRK